jgi:hypothetical protein
VPARPDDGRGGGEVEARASSISRASRLIVAGSAALTGFFLELVMISLPFTSSPSAASKLEQVSFCEIEKSTATNFFKKFVHEETAPSAPFIQFRMSRIILWLAREKLMRKQTKFLNASISVQPSRG